ncbi:unnamed protein product [Blepharisma stoltei]|uniref:Ankyrin repeat domain-containing protein n=1 Tax=Blepharisma stoltei TaxID=1481888 RepID=A0AAU9JC39_9CILI|nr:unnamed protein product [Blepharisma stoltei]
MEGRTIALTEWEIAGEKIINQNVFSLARHGKRKELEDLFKGGIDPDSLDRNGNTLFIIACQNNHKSIAKLCLRYGANINWRNNFDKTGKFYAKLFGYTALYEYLSGKGAEE